MDWIFFLIIAYFLIAIAVLVDKFILTKTVLPPVFYTVLISTLGLVVIVLAPFGFVFELDFYQLSKPALAGASFTLALFFLYYSLRLSEASRVFSFIGALSAFTTFFFSYLFLDQRLGLFQDIAFLFLVIGGILITLESRKEGRLRSWIWHGLTAAVLFGISYTAAQAAFDSQGFISGFIWLRVFAFLTALLFLLTKSNRQKIKDALKVKNGVKKGSNQLLIIGGQTLNGIGFVLLNYIISLDSAAIVLASQGLQYVFLLIFTLILSKKFPQIIKEKYTPNVLAQKIFAVLLIAIGLVFLTISPL